MNTVLLLSTGGTFNKIYNRINGKLEIDPKASAIQLIQEKWLSSYPYETIINKDSLEFTSNDREALKNYILNSVYTKIVVIHGTDTIHLSAQAVAEANRDKSIIFTGAMVPFSIDPIEAAANLGSAIGYLQAIDTPAVFIALNGRIAKYSQIQKNKKMGFFEYISKANIN